MKTQIQQLAQRSSANSLIPEESKKGAKSKLCACSLWEDFHQEKPCWDLISRDKMGPGGGGQGGITQHWDTGLDVALDGSPALQ